MSFSIWDFAGQEVYYSTHQFFLSSRALYLVVWNVAKPETLERVLFWIEVCYDVFVQFIGQIIDVFEYLGVRMCG